MRDAFLRAAVGASLVIWLGLCAAVHADPLDAPIHAGTQPAPPVRPGPPVLPQELDGRRAIRGCAVDERCARPGDLLREFEVEAFPPPGASPWLDERTPPPGRLEPGSPRPIVKRPSELRPDAPWLDQLELPDLPVRWSQTLVDYLVFYRDDPRGRSIMQSWLVAQGRYRDLILAHLRRAHLPEDLLYVAMIESGYDPGDTSSAGALGIWQFMPEGGRIYGLREDRWVDERRDPLRSTIAQMDYFADLHQRFADWNIALAAFNMGYGAMLRSIARYNTNDYYRLCEYENAIPWETCLYTPKVLAAAIVGHNRARYGFDKLTATPAEDWEEVAIPSSASLAAIARIAGAAEADLKRLNPQLRHGRTPPGEAGYLVRVPRGARAEAQRRLVELESDWKNHDAYVIAHGERFEDVATTFGISVAQLRKLNDVIRDAEIEGGTVLVVPRISDEQRARNRLKARANLHASGIDQKDGEPLIVAVPDKTAVVAGKRRVFYRVVAGDTLRSVARALGATGAELAQWNAIDPESNLQARMVLVAWVAPDFDADRRHVNLLDEAQLAIVTRGSPEHLDLAEARTGRVRTEYTAQGKEKLAEIAKKFGMGSHDLARINRISYDTVLAKGQTIIVYQVADPGRSKRADDQWKKTPRARRGKLTGTRAARTTSSNVPDDGADADAEADDDEADDDEAADKPAAEKRAADKPATEKRAADKPTAEKRAAEKSAAEKSAAEKRAAEKSAAEKRAADKSAAEKRAAEKSAADKPAAEKRAAEKSAAEKRAAEKRAADKPTEKRAAEKRAADKPAADKSAADRPAKPTPRSAPRDAEPAADPLQSGPVTDPAQLP